MIDKLIDHKPLNHYEDNNQSQFQSTTANDSYQLKSCYDESTEEIKKKLMEKDRAMIDQIKTIKELERKLQRVNKLNVELEEKNNALINKVNDLSIQLKHKESIINNQKEEIEMNQNKFQSITSQMQKDNSKLNKTIEELNSKAKLNEELLKKCNEENNKLQSLIKSKDNIIEENKTLNEKNEIIILQLKSDNKQIACLKRQLKEYEDIVSNSKKEISNIKGQYETLFKEKEKIEYDSKQRSQKNMSLKENREDNNRFINENQRLKQDNEFLNKAKTDLLIKYQTIQCDYDSFVNNTITQLGKIANDIETGTIIQNKSSIKPSMKNETVADLIQKSISLLNQSIISKLLSNKEQHDTLIDSYKEIETANHSLQNEKSSLLKANTVLVNQNNQYSNQYTEIVSTLNKVSQDYEKLKDSYVNLKEGYQKITHDIDMISKQTQTLLDSLITKLYSDKPIAETHLSLSDKINQGIDYLIDLNKTLSNKLTSIEGKNVILSKDKYDQLIKDNNELVIEITQLKKDINANEAKFKQREDDMISKVKELNYLLEESNQLVLDSNSQIKDMKERNRKLENNLEMLTKSHCELEQTIGSNESHIREEYHTLETKYYTLLCEIELKDIQIQSLEKLQLSERKLNNKPFIGELISKTMNQSNNEISSPNEVSNNIFMRNEDKERELQQMLITDTQSNQHPTDYSNNQIGKLQLNNQPKPF